MLSKIENIKNVIKKSSNPKLLEDAFNFAKEAYKDKKRLSGENYLNHAVRVTEILNSLRLDSQILAAALLHDVLDDLPTTAKNKQLKEIEHRFGKEIAEIIEKDLSVHKIRYSLLSNGKSEIDQEKFENLQKMFFALAGDLRIILIELASRLDNLNSLSSLPPEKQKIYSLEALKIFAPVADKLGIWEIKHRLEDMAFKYLFPENMAWVQSKIKARTKERKRYLKTFSHQLKTLLKKNGINAIRIDSRLKSHWSTYKKLLKYNKDVEKVHDLLALRVIVSNVENCYKTLGVINKRWKPLYDEIDDYIAKPRPNGYRSLHTTVVDEGGHITEIQIKTPEMHREAEYGICAHWAYKSKVDLLKNKEDFNLTKEIPEFWKKFKIDFYEDRVFAFTPMGDIISLKRGSTPIDFAYAVHSEVGNHCEAAKVNEKAVSLSSTIENGDIVEIVTNQKRKPSMDWLKIVKTTLAAAQIKKELAKYGLIGKIASIPSFISKKVSSIARDLGKKETHKKTGRPEILLDGQKNISITLAKCCNPKQGDEVKAYLSKYRSAVLHKTSCKEFQKLAKKFPDKVIDASFKK